MNLGPGIDSLPDSWPFDLGLAFLTAAQSCGFTATCSYVADGDRPDAWRWRSVDAVAHPYSSANLVAEWMARASIARGGCENADASIA